MIPTIHARCLDQLGRSGTFCPIRLLTLAVLAVITGSAWPISARSLDPICDNMSGYSSRRDQNAFVESVSSK